MALTKVSYSMVNGAPINILDFGADATGVGDSTNALKAAIAAAQASQGHVFIPIGEFRITDRILVNPAISIIGEDQDKSILKYNVALGTAASDSLLEIFNGSFFTIGNFCLDGNTRGGTTCGYGMQIYFCEDFEVSDVKFYDVRKGNLGLTEKSAFSLCERVKILRNRFIPLQNAAQEGIGITGVETCLIDGNIIDNPIDDSIAFHGPMYVGPAIQDPCENVIVSNNIVGNSIYLTPSPNGSGRLLLEGECKNILITGNVFYGNNESTYASIEFQNPLGAPTFTPLPEGFPTQVSIVGNQFYCLNLGNAQPAAIILALGTQISICNNRFANYTNTINVTIQSAGLLQNTNNILISGNHITGNGQGTTYGIIFGSNDFPNEVPSIVKVDGNFFGFDIDNPIYFSAAIDGETNAYWFSNNIQTGSQTTKPPGIVSGTPKYLDLSNNSWNYVNGIPVSNTWAKGSIQWTGVGATSGQPVGWICTAAGSPGTWKAFGTIA